MSGAASKLALGFVAAAIVALYAHAIFYTPIPYADQFQEIYRTFIWTPGQYLRTYLALQGPLFRPGEILLRYAILYGLGGDPFAYNYFQILFLALTAVAALSLVPCRNFTDAGAGTVALSFLFGHHAYVAVMEANITISNGVVLLMMLLVLHLLQSKGSLGAQIGAAALSLVAVLTKEVGLIVPVALASAAFLGFPGVRRATAIFLVALIVAYVGFRLAMLPTFAGETGASTPHSLAKRLSNMIATPVLMVTGDPFDGDWPQFLTRHFHPWRIIRISLGVATLIVILAAYLLRKRAATSFPETELVDGKWMLLLLIVTAASSAIAFQYTRHRFGAMALPVAFLLLDRSLRIVLWRLSLTDVQAWARAALVTLLFVFSLGWSTRVADGFFLLRYTGAKTKVDWVAKYEKYRDYEGRDPNTLPYLASAFWAAEEMPWPTIQHDSSLIRLWLGDDDVLNR